MYEGEFKEDKINGEGIMLMNDGRNMKGKWKYGYL